MASQIYQDTDGKWAYEFLVRESDTFSKASGFLSEVEARTASDMHLSLFEIDVKIFYGNTNWCFVLRDNFGIEIIGSDGFKTATAANAAANDARSQYLAAIV
jgi:hypothetical protein